MLVPDPVQVELRHIRLQLCNTKSGFTRRTSFVLVLPFAERLPPRMLLGSVATRALATSPGSASASAAGSRQPAENSVLACAADRSGTCAETGNPGICSSPSAFDSPPWLALPEARARVDIDHDDYNSVTVPHMVSRKTATDGETGGISICVCMCHKATGSPRGACVGL